MQAAAAAAAAEAADAKQAADAQQAATAHDSDAEELKLLQQTSSIDWKRRARLWKRLNMSTS